MTGTKARTARTTPKERVAAVLTRREVLAGAAAVSVLGARASAQESWRAGAVAHLLATANEERLLLKASFTAAQPAPPELVLDGRAFAGRATASPGRFFVFDAPGLEAGWRYELRLRGGDGAWLCDPWPFSTLPARDARPEHLRLLVYTCAGGHDQLVRRGERHFRTLAERRRLLARGLSFQPHAVIANGDHVYWDQRTGEGGRGPGRIAEAIAIAGEFDRSAPLFGSPNEPLLGSANESVLERAVGPQVAELYGTLLRSVPVFFLQDDHDYFEGDRVRPWLVPFPPDPFMLQAARASQWLYYPELLPDRGRPAGLASASAGDRPPGVAEAYGTLRYGRLAEVLLYDCRRHLTLFGDLATFVDPEAERWLLRRMAESEARHVVNAPGVPVGWTAGKWGEWYPDALGADGRLTTEAPKELWQAGWFAQHNRLLAAAARMPRVPLFLNGDLHSLGAGTIERSGDLDLSANPIRTVLCGPLGTGTGWPSAGRGTRGAPSRRLEMVEDLPCVEENGFCLVDFTPDDVAVRLFRWRPEQGVDAIDTLEPFFERRYRHPAGSP